MIRAEEAKLLQLRLHQLAQRTERMDAPSVGRFLTAEERSLAVHEARQCCVKVAFDGGWADAERAQVCFYSDWDEPVFTHQWLEIRWNGRFSRVDHRDLLGSLMALGMDRAFFGDLIVQEEHAYLCAMPEVAQRLPTEWDKAGNTSIRVRLMDTPPVIEPPKGIQMRDTVASLRLDNVLASGMKLSRSRAAELIRQGLVAVDHQTEDRVDRQLDAGQLLSIRGFGRVRIVDVGQPNRKDRLPVILEIFARN